MESRLMLLFLLCYLIPRVSSTHVEYENCNCEEDGFLSIQNLVVGQKVSGYFIFVAYFSIPIIVLYFVIHPNALFKFIFLLFIAFTVLCGITHLLNSYSYHDPVSFYLVLSVTVAKFLTALVSYAIAFALPHFIRLLFRIKMREHFLMRTVVELDQEIGMMKKQKEASWYVSMLTRKIRNSLDRQTILYTTLVELSKTLDLHNYAVWTPDQDREEMLLTHQLKTHLAKNFHNSIPMKDLDVLEINKTKAVRILSPKSALGAASSGVPGESGAIAAIRMPILHVSNDKGGTPESSMTCYAILVLVLPRSNSRVWTCNEMKILEVVADQVAIALSHSSIIEESQLMRQKLVEQNRALQQARKDAMMACQARKSFLQVTSHGMRRPTHSILELLSLLKEGNMRPEQKVIGETMLKVGNVISTLINDGMEISENEKGDFVLEMKPFILHSIMREAACIANCLCVYKGFGFEIDVQTSLPNQVIGDDTRAFQVILHMIGYLLNIHDRGNLMLLVSFENFGGNNGDGSFEIWRPTSQNEHVLVKFDFKITGNSQSDESISTSAGRRHYNNEPKEGLSFSMCKKLVQMMGGNMWISPNSLGLAQGMTLLLKFHIAPSHEKSSIFAAEDSSSSQFRGLKVLLVDDDNINRAVTKKLLEKLGCQVTVFSTGIECIGAISCSGNSFKIILLDLDMAEMDGFQVAKRIRKAPSRNFPLIIALTASSEEHLKEKCIQVGMNGLIRKPILLHEIADELRTILQRAGEKLGKQF